MAAHEESIPVCVEPRCVAIVAPGFDRCVIHLAVGRRSAKGIGIKCYACGNRLRLGALFFVRAEGAFHLRPVCMNAPRDTWKVQVAA